MPTLDFYFAPGSRYSYLATCRLPIMEQTYGVEFDWIPVTGTRIRALRGVDPFNGALCRRVAENTGLDEDEFSAWLVEP